MLQSRAALLNHYWTLGILGDLVKMGCLVRGQGQESYFLNAPDQFNSQGRLYSRLFQ